MTGKLSEPHADVVRRIMNEMLDGGWVTGESHRKYMDEFGVKLDTVQRWAAEAHMFLKLCRGNEEEIRQRILAQVDMLQKKALSAVKHLVVNGDIQEVPSPDLKTFLGSVEFISRCYGVDKPKETPTETISEEELAELLRARGYRVEAPETTADVTEAVDLPKG